MNKSILLFIILITAGAARCTAQQYWQQQVDYTIDVTLIDSTRSLDGNISIRYINNSPDTLPFIWIHCWPNAYKNDRTALSEQLIREGRTDFYFSSKDQRGYINHLEFRADGQLARMEDHPQYIDIIRVILPAPLPPHGQVLLSTPFHVQLPYDFTRNGYDGRAYQVIQWYPQPAVYDRYGWHPIPCLDQGGSYSDFGDFDVHITVPAGFIVAATGELQDTPGQLQDISLSPTPASPAPASPTPASPAGARTLHYRQRNSTGFAWFADRRFRTAHDTLQLPSGRIIDLYSFYPTSANSPWRLALDDLKRAIRYRSLRIGEYPYPVATVVQTRSAGHENSSYPTLAAIDVSDSFYRRLDLSIEREIGQNWFSAAISPDGYRYPWLTEGLNAYYNNFYDRASYGPPFRMYFAPDTINRFHLEDINTLALLKEDQPVTTSAEDFTAKNYSLIAIGKTALWMQQLRDTLGAALFDSCMRAWFRSEQDRHPYPDDFKAIFTATSNRNLDRLFAQLDRTGPLPPLSPFPDPRPTRVSSGNSNTDNIIHILPAVGYNEYDHVMAGLLIHNFNRPPERWQMLLAPLYATGSHQFNGLAHFNYAWRPAATAAPAPHPAFRLLEAGINASRFSTISGADSNGHRIFGGFYKVVPYLRLFFPRPSPQSTWDGWLEWKTYLIGEKQLDNYVLKTSDSLYYPTPGKYSFRYLNQLGFTILDRRTLYPYRVSLQVQQAAPWYRLNLNINYFFNYDAGGGLGVRLFGAKFGYLGARDPSQDLTPYEPKLTAVRGSEDYTYDNYFIGRNEFNGLASQQIMLRDGDLKLRTDLFQGLQGRSDDWVAAVNFNSTIPPQILPAWIPLSLFLDAGTYAQAWGDNPPTSHFLYVGGLQLSLFDVLRIYAPLVYSSDFSSQLKTVPGQNGFFQKISFSIDFEHIPFRKQYGYTPF